MWPGNGNMPSGMWSAPGHNPMMESQWTAHYQTMPQNQVDWASLAQQWIQMKGSMPEPAPNMYGHPVHQQQMPPHSPALPAPPPPPSINHHIPSEQPPSIPDSNTGHYHSFHAEGGVANMDLEEPEPEMPSYVNTKPMHDYHSSRRYVPSPHHTNIEQDQNRRRYFPPQNQPPTWNHSQYNAAGPSSHHGGMLMDDPNADLDAAARKKLPVWIRQGLEKMEKEKQKREEAQIKAKLREEKLRKQRELELKRSPQKSKFDDMTSDASDVDNDNTDDDIEQSKMPHVRKSRFDEREPIEDSKRESLSSEDEDEVANPTQKREITKAEILEEMTFALRRAMTEILLEVTNEEITGIASDIIKSETGKKSKKSVRKSGLQGVMANYGSDDEEKSSDSSDTSSSDDSDVDIQNRLKKKKKSFERLEADILENCDALEKDYEDREKKWKAGIPNQGLETKSKNGSTFDPTISTDEKDQETMKKRPSEEAVESRPRKLSESGKRDRKESEPSSSRSRHRSRSKDRGKNKSSGSSRKRSKSREDRSSNRRRSVDRASSKRTRSRDRKRSRSRSRDHRRRSRSKSRDRKRSRDRSDRKRSRSRSKSRDRKRSRDRSDRKRSRSRDRHSRKRSRSRDEKKQKPGSSRRKRRRHSDSSDTSSSTSTSRS